MALPEDNRAGPTIDQDAATLIFDDDVRKKDNLAGTERDQMASKLGTTVSTAEEGGEARGQIQALFNIERSDSSPVNQLNVDEPVFWGGYAEKLPGAAKLFGTKRCD